MHALVTHKVLVSRVVHQHTAFFTGRAIRGRLDHGCGNVGMQGILKAAGRAFKVPMATLCANLKCRRRQPGRPHLFLTASFFMIAIYRSG
jgi:hypothetical protein